MAGSISREAYFQTGLEVLADLGYGGLKLAEVCNRLGVTTGSFYHYFPSWPEYARDLVAHWAQELTVRVAAEARGEADPRRRIDLLIGEALALPHGAEAAIRVWSAVDPAVHAVQSSVDRQRFDVLFEAATHVIADTRQAHLFTSLAVYLLVGYEQATLPRDAATARWISRQLRELLDSGRLAAAGD